MIPARAAASPRPPAPPSPPAAAPPIETRLGFPTSPPAENPDMSDSH
jgi:hypothetical protein